jgi:acyl phosphate:glycerol-3-phosphate acyltransferase
MLANPAFFRSLLSKRLSQYSQFRLLHKQEQNVYEPLMFDQLLLPASLPYFLAALAFGYCFGSIPFGLLLTRLGGTADIRSIGSGNIGATNVLRTGRKDLAAATLLLDGLKATAAVLIAVHLWPGGQQAGLYAGLGAFLGHLFPVWLGFKGGKGVATFIGALLGLYWPAMLAFAVIWLAVAFLSRYSSLSALIATATMPVFLWFMNLPEEALFFLLMGALLYWKHRPNISRLLAGTEGRIGAKG